MVCTTPHTCIQDIHLTPSANDDLCHNKVTDIVLYYDTITNRCCTAVAPYPGENFFNAQRSTCRGTEGLIL